MEDLFRSYWWLLFPLFWMVMGVLGSFGHYRQRSETLKLLKTYADQGKEPPQALLDMLKSDEQRAHDYSGYGYRGRGGRHRGWWPQVVVFGALSVGFGYYGYYAGGHQIFTALALGFGVAAMALTVIGIIRAMFGPKYVDKYPDKDLE
jgi:hypothetical protein